MRRAALLLALGAASCAGPSADAGPPADAGFTRLFDGRTLKGWRGRPQLDPREEAALAPERRAALQAEWNADRDRHWRVEDGVLVNDGEGLFLTTERDYGDFELKLEYRTVAGADSGVYLRGCPQVQIWDTTEAGGKWELGADRGSGGLWNNQRHERFPLVHADRPFGEWNALRVVMVGARVSVWLNGELTVDCVPLENYFDRDRPVPARGPIQLQTHGGAIAWRAIAVREIAPEEADRLLAAHDAEGWRPLFDGYSLDGWEGAVDGYEVAEGAIRYRESSGGNLYTAEEFGDFELRLRFLLPPGGNNGLAIRYPGEGNPAYDGMCELQVLDDGAEKYAGLRPWQYHGSAYGMMAAHRGYLRPPGTWNFQRVRVQGSTVQVELNGTVILDCDLEEVEDPESGQVHPGRALTSGRLGFAGHGDPVAFREIQVRPL